MQTFGEEGEGNGGPLPSTIPCFAKKIQLKPKITFEKSTSRLRRVKITENIFPSMLERGEEERDCLSCAEPRAHCLSSKPENVARVIFKKRIPTRKLFFAFLFLSFFLPILSNSRQFLFPVYSREINTNNTSEIT